jgi:hypothetical protein
LTSSFVQQNQRRVFYTDDMNTTHTRIRQHRNNDTPRQ